MLTTSDNFIAEIFLEQNKLLGLDTLSLPSHFGKTIQGTDGGEIQPSHDIPRYLPLLEAKK